MKTKYLIYDNGLAEIVVVFPGIIKHEAIGVNGKIVSAGFISLPECHCWGRSISLNVDSRPEDTKLAQRQLLPQDAF